MKRTLLVLTVGALLACPLFAQPTGSTSAPPPGGHHPGMDSLTESEKQEMHKAHDAALAANPSLGTEEQGMRDQMKTAHDSGQPPSDDLKAKMHAFRDKMDAAMIQADANVAPIIAKLKAHHGSHGGPGGPPPANK